MGLKGLIPESDLESGFQRGVFRIVVPMVVAVGLHAECRGGLVTSYGISRPCETYDLRYKLDSKQVANRDPPLPPPGEMDENSRVANEAHLPYKMLLRRLPFSSIRAAMGKIPNRKHHTRTKEARGARSHHFGFVSRNENAQQMIKGLKIFKKRKMVKTKKAPQIVNKWSGVLKIVKT